MPGKKEDQRAPKIYNLMQIGSNPPTFKMTVNFPAAIAEAWKKWFEKQFRLKFGFEGTPIDIKYIKRI
jgi:GTP-binding protein